jgi:hypothetical protein
MLSVSVCKEREGKDAVLLVSIDDIMERMSLSVYYCKLNLA